jgi:SAM-dependent methyltransferase
MPIARRITNRVRGFIQSYGPERLKRRVWNSEYAGGRWVGLESMVGDCLYRHVEEHTRVGDILDLGCGPGAMAAELDEGSYRSYTGVDISDVAIAKARARTAGTSRAAKNRYCQGDILLYQPDQRYDVIVFGDSIYYLAHHQIHRTLMRYAQHLKEDGVFVVKLFGYEKIAGFIRRNFDVVEQHLYQDAQVSVLVFRSPTAAMSRLSCTGQAPAEQCSRPRNGGGMLVRKPARNESKSHQVSAGRRRIAETTSYW